jgi:UDP-N-acetylenolpyruvoylglucosamine reductase
VLVPVLANLAAKRGLAGLEFGAGIPGTLGGALVMNAGWHQWEIGQSVEEVAWLSPEGEVRTLLAHACGFRYRGSFFRDRGGIVLEAMLRLTPEDPQALLARVDSFADSRKANQPTELPSCGSVFLKPEGDFAGRLIEQAGLKGYRIGGIEVSPQARDFFVNVGGGTAADVLALVAHVERTVLEQLGVRLTREFVAWWGLAGDQRPHLLHEAVAAGGIEDHGVGLVGEQSPRRARASLPPRGARAPRSPPWSRSGGRARRAPGRCGARGRCAAPAPPGSRAPRD